MAWGVSYPGVVYTIYGLVPSRTSQEVRLVTLELFLEFWVLAQSACAKSHMTSGRVHVLFIEFPTAHAQSSYKI